MKTILWFLMLFFLHKCLCYENYELLNVFEAAKNKSTFSDECADALVLYLENLFSGFDDPWAAKMFDASSKLPVGLSKISFGEMGDFDLCLKTESKDHSIKARYCLSYINWESLVDTNSTSDQSQINLIPLVSYFANITTQKVDKSIPFGPTWAVCVPSQCTKEDVVQILKNIGLGQATCYTKDNLIPPLTSEAILAIVLLSFIAVLMAFSTIYDLICAYKDVEPGHPVFVAFSVYRNGIKLFKISKGRSDIPCLNGLRFFSTVWVLTWHIFLFIIVSPLSNLVDYIDWLNKLRSMIIFNAPPVDTFFVIGSFLVVYGFMRSQYNGGHFNIFHFYVHRYIRLTPALAAAVLVTSTLSIYFGTGPHWNGMYLLQDPCKKYWWSTLLYVGNYVNVDEPCLPHVWSLAVDMQMYFLSPIILLPLWKYPKIGVPLLGTLILGSLIIPFCITYTENLSAIVTTFHYQTSPLKYWFDYYFKTHMRVTPWLIGASLGYLLANIKYRNTKIPKLNKITVILIWTVCFCVMITCIYGGHSTLRSADYDRIANAMHLTFVKPAWSICIVWIIFACVMDYAGPINTFLSLPIFQILNRLTYSLYIVHFSLLCMMMFGAKRPTYFNELSLAYSFWGVFMSSLVVSIVWVLAFESPMTTLEQVIFKRKKMK